MKKSIPIGAAMAVGLLFAGLVGGLLPSASAAPPTVVVYDSIGPSVPGNVFSQPFQAQQTSEFGDRVVLAAGPRYLRSVTITMSSWGCESGNWNLGDCLTTPGATFNHDLTLTIYAPPAAGLGTGATILTSTQNFNIPLRPSASASCGDGRWSNGTSCFNGYATPVTFTFDGTVLLPDDLIWGIAYNTSGYGPTPLGYATACALTPQGCGYDSLNVGLSQAPLTTTGTDVDSDGVYWNTVTPGYYCDGDVGGLGTFRSDTSCWTGYRPMARIETSIAVVGPPTNVDQCKKDGWKSFNNPAFKNQGQCVSAVVKA